ncbi:MAG: hypothetical protein CL608_14335 [Anaerolineaceae bacterium]|nr:hypothetical protein [Anaerolineaceae bacterium]
MISPANSDQLFAQRRRMPLWLARLGCATLIILSLLVVGYFAWIYFIFSFGGPPLAQEVALADLNGDGHLDAYVTISPQGEPYCALDWVLFGDGNGRFTASDQELESCSTFAVSLGDVNNDGMVDAIVGNRFFRNYDNGRFTDGVFLPISSEGAFRWQARLADLNGDGALDLFGAGCCGGMVVSPETERRPLYSNDVIWLNNGAGVFFDSGQLLGDMGSNAVALGDLNGNGSIDAFVATGQTTPGERSSFQNPNFVWFNDGSGQFSDSGQRLGEAESTAVALGDFDGDGDLDAVVGNNGRDELWLNDGQGNFSLSAQRFNSDNTRAVFAADLNEDGLPDLVIAGETSSRVWLNKGAATFQSGQRVRHQDDDAIALGDVNEDGLVDVLVAGVEKYQVWHGEGNGRFSADSHTPYQE